MRVIRDTGKLRIELLVERAERSIGFVPTMGALHDGHLSLVRAARTATDVVVVSIFVNPLQFGTGEDYSRYPRDEARDLELLEAGGVDVAFLPEFPGLGETLVTVGELGEILEGVSRPGHFAGVATIVTKLFNVVQPDVAFFGEKDAQQLAVIRQLVEDLSSPIDVRACPTVRERDGLAMSSRNAYLDVGERTRATALFEALETGARVLRTDADRELVEKTMWETMSTRAVEPEYAAVVDSATFRPYSGRGPARLVVAARVGRTRLIDNLLLPEVPTASMED